MKPICNSLAAVLVGGVSLLAVGASAQASGDPARGATLYQTRCAACHSIDMNRIGPKHRGVVGRRAGAEPGFAYSAALAKSGLTWDVATLDRWLSGPPKLVPGTTMGIAIAAPTDRRDIIAYLATQK